MPGGLKSSADARATPQCCSQRLPGQGVVAGQGGGPGFGPGAGIPVGGGSMPMAIHGQAFMPVAGPQSSSPGPATMPPAGVLPHEAEQQFQSAAAGAAAVEPAVPSQLNAGYLPPMPPDPLPPQPREIAQPGPDLGGAYRSTLNVPPPQLLDAQQPPPLAVAWTAHEAARPPVPQTAPRTSFVPPKYRVRDGDDLAGIAARFYGHPAAAASIWAANRDVISDPGLLPIGAQLALPPAWSIAAARSDSAAGSAIEPAGGSVPTASMVAGSPPAAAVHPWLTPDAGAASAPMQTPPVHVAPVQAQPVHVAPVQAAAFRPAGVQQLQNHPAHGSPQGRPPRIVRVAPGESLVTIAQQFYGDAGMAQRIWEANRSRLRSPDLLVPGMELTLP